MNMQLTEKISGSSFPESTEANGYRHDTFYKDNLEHLEYLEYITRLRLAEAFLRNNQTASDGIDNPSAQFGNNIGKYVTGGPCKNHCSEIAGEITLEKITATREKYEQINAAFVENSTQKGIELKFEKFCRSFNLDNIERTIVLLLLANNTGKKFRDFYEHCDIDPNDNGDGGMTIGTILSIIFPEYRDQILNLEYFSVNSSLIKHEIFILLGRYHNTDNIFNETVYIHERIIRYIIGDDNVYNAGLQCITRQKSRVKLEQVILPDTFKKEIVKLINNYSGSQKNLINAFFGYGTGLTFFFFGKSGTGKTMLANAIAHTMGMALLSVNVEKAMDADASFEDILKHLFREAKLAKGIVFIDECDDILRNNASYSRALLIEIEKAECVTILATNKVVDLDPALDRRITMKVPFNIPDETQREKIWKTLIPPNISTAEDVDFKKLSKNYIFTGGLIKNALFMGIISAMKGNNTPVIHLTMQDIEQAANHQTVSMFDLNGIGEYYTPKKSIQDLPLRPGNIITIKRLASAYTRFSDKDQGIKTLIGSSSIQTGLDCAEAIAKECSLQVRKFNLGDFIYGKSGEKEIVDPITQNKLSLIDYIFSQSLGHKSLILLVDNDGFLSLHLSNEQKKRDKEMTGLAEKIRKYKGSLCFVTQQERENRIPPEFDYYLEIQTPPEELQISQWERHFDDSNDMEDDIIDLVEKYPLHLNEIDIIARQARIASYLNDGETAVSIHQVHKAIKRYKGVKGTHLLFGINR